MIGKSGYALLAVVFSLTAACATSEGTGALTGGVGGGVIGGGIGALAGGTKGAIIGAALGGVVGGGSGALIGRYMDKQKEKLDRDLKSGYVEKVGNKLVVKFDSGILFDVDQASLKGSAQSDLAEFARVLNEYPDTKLEIQGHTDSTGSKEHNRRLSQERADAVVSYLTQAQVARSRIVSEGLGEAGPVSSNATADGRAKNRRVEIHITPNEELKKADAENAAKRS
jgi:outer membrane protein OmpA-like peptidoglycan-associated protein